MFPKVGPEGSANALMGGIFFTGLLCYMLLVAYRKHHSGVKVSKSEVLGVVIGMGCLIGLAFARAFKGK